MQTMNIKDDFRVVVIGGTGTFGHEMVKQLLLDSRFKEIIVFSRDEYKQMKMKEKIYNDDNFFDVIMENMRVKERLSFIVGDIRNKYTLLNVFSYVDIVIHAAAMKNIVTCELNPYEAIQTNIIGAKNIIDAAINNKVKRVIGISTDKAVEPINLYGNTKACMEKLFIDANYKYYKSALYNTRFSIVRYGNVINSRGSVIPFWKNQKEKGEKLSLTNENMTRFFIKIKDAVNFVKWCIYNMRGFEVFIPRMKSIKMYELCKIIAGDENNIKITGIRPGEKLHETLISDMQHDKKILYYDDKYIVLPKNISNIYKDFEEIIEKNYCYDSINNFDWVSNEKMKELITND